MKELHNKEKVNLSKNIPITLIFEKWVIQNLLINIKQYSDLIVVIQAIDDKDLNYSNDRIYRENLEHILRKESTIKETTIKDCGH